MTYIHKHICSIVNVIVCTTFNVPTIYSNLSTLCIRLSSIKMLYLIFLCSRSNLKYSREPIISSIFNKSVYTCPIVITDVISLCSIWIIHTKIFEGRRLIRSRYNSSNSVSISRKIITINC